MGGIASYFNLIVLVHIFLNIIKQQVIAKHVAIGFFVYFIFSL